MRLPLLIHPESRCEAVETIDVEIKRSAGGLRLRYRLTGRIDELALPAAGPVQRGDELWRHTCFEAFLKGETTAYDEFNFAPSRAWAAYSFDDYRAGMRPGEITAPQIEVARLADGFELMAVFEVPVRRAHLGLSAVVEERGGAKSYWALAHPPGKPDFHGPDCFALDLRSVERS